LPVTDVLVHVHVNPHTHKPVELCDYYLKSSTHIHVTPIF